MREKHACKGNTRYVEMRGRKEIPGGTRDFTVQGMDTMNGEKWDFSGTQLYLALPR